VPDVHTSDRLLSDDEDWMTGIASMHGQAAGGGVVAPADLRVIRVPLIGMAFLLTAARCAVNISG
jgi:hypothetical protein